MHRTLRKTLIGVISVLLVLCIALAVLGFYTVRSSFPQVSGEIQVAGLEKPVDVYRDAYGVPHIFATSDHDDFYAQGYVHAQDRFWQMDFWRHIGSGRLSELFGASSLGTDKFLRTLGWARVAQQEIQTLDTESLAILETYADGVNAFLADHQGSALSLEYSVLKLLNPSYRPEPWKPLHTLTWAKAMAWDLGGNMDGEIERAILLKTLTPEQLADIDPPYPADHPYILPDFRLGMLEVDNSIADLGIDYSSVSLLQALQSVENQSQALEAVLGPRGAGIGSNNWAISGKLTRTGMPLLANDPHLSIQMPSIWYEIGLHCQPKGPQCRFDVTGVSFAGAPGVVIGHNDKIAWGFTNVGPDVQDLFVEKINPSNPNQYEVNGRWEDMELVQETIQVSGSEPVEMTVRYTRHGPIVSETYGSLEDFEEKSGVQVPENYAIALRWTALESSNTFPALWKLNLAHNFDEFRSALSLFDVPSQNMVYADIEGNIGYQTPSKIPIRHAGDGRLPVPGWTDEYEWEGYIPFEELPFTYNPSQGYVATANNAVVSPEYPYMISMEWDHGYRARRIVDLIERAPGPIDISYIQIMQGDSRDLSAEFTIPLLLKLQTKDPRITSALELFSNWDYQSSIESSPAALYTTFWRNLVVITFQDDLPEDYWPEGGSRWFEVMRNLVNQPQSTWWDDKTTSETETRDAIFERAFIIAVDELEQKLGNDPSRWTWGDIHMATFRNQSLGESGVAPIEALFNRGPFRAPGGDSIVNAIGWSMSDPYEVDWLPSMRMIVDLSDLQNSLMVHTTGQSGHAYHPHYIDLADLWRTTRYHPMLWDRNQVEASAESYLKLMP